MAKIEPGKYLPTGTRIAQLVNELGAMGAYQAMRHVQAAAEVFHEDVMRIEGATQ